MYCTVSGAIVRKVFEVPIVSLESLSTQLVPPAMIPGSTELSLSRCPTCYDSASTDERSANALRSMGVPLQSTLNGFIEGDCSSAMVSASTQRCRAVRTSSVTCMLNHERGTLIQTFTRGHNNTPM